MRVYCLYRVSTKGQVEQNDIPMQRKECHVFAKKWSGQSAKSFLKRGCQDLKFQLRIGM